MLITILNNNIERRRSILWRRYKLIQSGMISWQSWDKSLIKVWIMRHYIKFHLYKFYCKHKLWFENTIVENNLNNNKSTSKKLKPFCIINSIKQN